MNDKTLKELETYILKTWDITPEEFLMASESLSSIIMLVSRCSGLDERKVRDILNNVIGRG